jgi:hypothetical protein
VTPDTRFQLPAPEGENSRLNPVAASCVLSMAGYVQVTMRALPGAWASDTPLGGFAIWGVDGAGVGCGCAIVGVWAIIVAVPRFAGRGVGRYIGIFMTVLYLEKLLGLTMLASAIC